MIRTTRRFTRLAVIVGTALGLLLASAGQATAQRLADPDGGGGVHERPTPVPPPPVVDASLSVLQWTLLAVAVVGALVLGAVLMSLALRQRGALPVTDGEEAVRSSA
jgi:hypothetical protein